MPMPLPLLLLFLAVDAPAALPPEFEIWSQSVPAVSAPDPTHPGETVMRPGKSLDLALSPTATVHYAVAPAKPPQPETFGGTVRLRITRAGTYSIALDAAAWIDVVQHGRGIDSVSYRRAPEGSGLHKIVDFPLSSGSYLVQIVGSGQQKVRIMVVPASPPG